MGESRTYFYAAGAKTIKGKTEDSRDGITDGKRSLSSSWAQGVRLV